MTKRSSGASGAKSYLIKKDRINKIESSFPAVFMTRKYSESFQTSRFDYNLPKAKLPTEIRIIRIQ